MTLTLHLLQFHCLLLLNVRVFDNLNKLVNCLVVVAQAEVKYDKALVRPMKEQSVFLEGILVSLSLANEQMETIETAAVHKLCYM